MAFSSAGSSDPDGDALSYLWKFGDGTPSSTAPNPSHTYTAGGVYTASLTVSDGQGHADAKTVTVTVGNSAPTASITAPTAATRYRGGEAVTLLGSGSDREDGALPESAFAWKVLLHHGTHIHELSEGTGTRSSFVPAIDHDADSRYEIRLTVTDSGALTHTTSVDVSPQTIGLTLASSPPGAPLDYVGGQSAPAPFTRVAAVGYRATVAAAESFVRDGITYRFASWSDGETRQHDVSIPASDTTLTATYTASGAGEAVETLAFTPQADTWVDASQPTTSFGASSRMRVDASPRSQAYLRFKVAGLAGRPVRRVRLRLFQRDASDAGRPGLQDELQLVERGGHVEHPSGDRRCRSSRPSAPWNRRSPTRSTWVRARSRVTARCRSAWTPRATTAASGAHGATSRPRSCSWTSPPQRGRSWMVSARWPGPRSPRATQPTSPATGGSRSPPRDASWSSTDTPARECSSHGAIRAAPGSARPPARVPKGSFWPAPGPATGRRRSPWPVTPPARSTRGSCGRDRAPPHAEACRWSG